MEENVMNKDELIDIRIKEYSDLQRIKNSTDKDAEIEYQVKILKAQLQSLGIHTEDLE
ncbi:MAG: hypothetical protein IJ873_03720 [Lachnospiraceae bacterium]|nr:hypothetical protein [Lachnospiraceae bacterium]